VKLLEPSVAVQRATFAMGCFWHPDSLFGSISGVVRTKVGYTGGSKANPTYYELGDHTEAIDIEFDPTVTNYNSLLSVFFREHDATERHKRQYMSAIYCHDQDQRMEATNALKSQPNSSAIVTDLVDASIFYDAEDYHQKYRLQHYPELLQLLGIKDGAQLKHSHVCSRLNAFLGGYGTLAEFDSACEKLGMPEAAAKIVRSAVAKGIVPHC